MDFEQATLKLTKYNRDKFEEFCLYLYSNNLNPVEVINLKHEILDHLIEGQSKGKDFNDLFGNDYKKYSDLLIEQLAKESWENQFKFSLFVWIVAVITRLFSLLRGHSFSEIALDLLLFPLILSVCSFVFFKITKWAAFKNSIWFIILTVFFIQGSSFLYSLIKLYFT